VSWLRLITVGVVLLSAVSCFAADPNARNEQERTIVSRETAQNWIQVGLLQSKKGLYEQAEKSFLSAKEYHDSLSADEQTQLEKHLTEAHQAMVERQPVLEHIKKARELLSQNQPVKARAHFEKVRKSPYLTEQERKQIDQEIKDSDTGFDRQRKEMTELYNRSVELYRAGEMEKARDGFVEVARYGLLVVPQGQAAEDYLIQIDSILTEQLKGASDANKSSPAALPPAKEEPKAKNITQPPPSEVTLLRPAADAAPVEKPKDKLPQESQIQEEKTKAPVEAEPQPETPIADEKEVPKAQPAEVTLDKDARAKIAKSYTKAVVDDAGVKSDYYISTGEFDKAIDKVRTATEVVKKNRPLIGDELFTQYSVRLKQLAENIIHAKKS
jgi:tetratricopeptide (TPR) repeat protein